ncbi:MAG: MBL fold metallo-hydrolase [Pseudomonadota bacterium]
MASLRFTILGCGSSGGVPRLGDKWGDCDPTNPKNRRRRCSLLAERITDDGTTRVLVDTSPDMRDQLLSAGIGDLDGVVFTHPHADHVHGIDDLRMIVFNRRQMLDIWADDPTFAALTARFGYAFETPPGSSYPPILRRHGLDGTIHVPGPGGDLTLSPIPVGHGDIDALGLRIGDLAYMPDVNTIPESSDWLLEGLHVWVLDALRRTPHPSHLSYQEAMAWFDKMRPARGILTNMHVDMDYATVAAETPDHIEPAFDGMVIDLPDD